MALWTTVDSPWPTHTDRVTFDQTIAAVRALDARRVLSAHLPPAAWMTDRLLDPLATVPGSAPWVGPDQHALDQLLAAVGG